MAARAMIAVFALLECALVLSGCGKKHRATAAPVALPQIRHTETGLASWYGHPYHGRTAANGELYDMEKLTAAHRTLPFGTQVRVTNLSNDRAVEVRIIDRGPFIDGRIIDVSHAAAEAIGMIGAGIAQVRLDVLAIPDLAVIDNWYAVQVGAFRDKERAEQLRRTLEREYGAARLVVRPGNPPLWRVLVGKERTEEGAGALAARIRLGVGSAFVVRLDQAGAASKTLDSSNSQP
jgi:peptidoglycan lytic transglycosylase